MPARDLYHDAVVNALIADGWEITHDPLSLSYGGKDLYVDLGAERATIAAEKEGQKKVFFQLLQGLPLGHNLQVFQELTQPELFAFPVHHRQAVLHMRPPSPRDRAL